MILKRMKRRHCAPTRSRFCRRVRAVRPDMVFGADLIAGFPTETEAMFRRTLDLVDDCGLTWLHVFAYSERAGTPAARMPQVDKAVRRDRALRLREKGAAAAAAFLDRSVGTEARLLVERDGAGYTEHFAAADLDGGARRGRIVPVRITGVRRRASQGFDTGDARRMSGSWFSRLKAGLSKSSAKIADGISGLFTGKRRLDDDMLEQLEDQLVMADLGPATAAKLTANLAKTRFDKEVTADEVRLAFAEDIAGHSGAGGPADGCGRATTSPTWCWSSASTARARPPPSASWPRR